MVVVYGLMTLGGYWWLAWRERTVVIAAWAIGPRGVALAAVAGSATGFALFAAARCLCRYFRPFAALDARLMSVIGPLVARDALALAMVSGVAEEFFFRCAAQDAAGWLGAAFLFALGHLGGPGLYLWSVQGLFCGLVFGALVHNGFGVLSAALAHSLFNYLWLQRLTV